jgi:hypothetical protein
VRSLGARQHPRMTLRCDGRRCAGCGSQMLVFVLRSANSEALTQNCVKAPLSIGQGCYRLRSL